eukprot:IDg19812t1
MSTVPDLTAVEYKPHAWIEEREYLGTDLERALGVRKRANVAHALLWRQLLFLAVVSPRPTALLRSATVAVIHPSTHPHALYTHTTRMNSLLGKVKEAATSAGIDEAAATAAVKNAMASAGTTAAAAPGAAKDAATSATSAVAAAPGAAKDAATSATSAVAAAPGAVVNGAKSANGALESMIKERVGQVAGAEVANSAQADKVISQVADAIGDKVPASLLAKAGAGAKPADGGAAAPAAAPVDPNALLGKAMGMFGK